jgi:hypothetical protein
MSIRRWPVAGIAAVVAALFVTMGAPAVLGCGPWLTFRTYLRRSFWQPVRYSVEDLTSDWSRGAVTHRYAGFAGNAVPPALAALRAAYEPLASGETSAIADVSTPLAHAREACTAALAPGALSGANLEEARLLEAKITLRAAERTHDLLPEARRTLEAFLASGPSAPARSEARGWLGRVLHLQGDDVASTKIYLDELEAPPATVPFASLARSIRIVLLANEQQLWDRVAEFFDTPRHALFVVNVLTNPQSEWTTPMPNADRSRRGAAVLSLLRQHRTLFQGGADSDRLVMAVMRASLFMGDADGALRDAQAVAPSSALQQDPEFNWMQASALFLRGERARAEEPLVRMMQSTRATVADRRTAGDALTGVYVETRRPVDALRAAFVRETMPVADGAAFSAAGPRGYVFAHWEALDLPYLLDAWLTDDDLRAYLTRYPAPVGQPLAVFRSEARRFTAPQIVRYTLAVRHAQHQAYGAAERIYTELNVPARAARMHALADLAARAGDPKRSSDERWAARYEQAAFLADNPERILFNDLFWRGFQSLALLDRPGRPEEEPDLDVPADLRAATQRANRRLRDDQEERWQAVALLEPIVGQTRDQALARKAVLKILDCLVRINTERFGREQEIRAMTAKWVTWLKANPAR